MPNTIVEEFRLSRVALILREGIWSRRDQCKRKQSEDLMGTSGPDLDEGKGHTKMLQVRLHTLHPLLLPLQTLLSVHSSLPPLTSASKTFSNQHSRQMPPVNQLVQEVKSQPKPETMG